MDIVNELTEYEINLGFKNTRGTEITPAAANYRITDDAGTVIVPTTPITISGPTASLIIDATVNVCTVDGGDIQERRVVVKAAGLAQVVHTYRLKKIT